MSEGNQLGQRRGAGAAQDERRGVCLGQIIGGRLCSQRHVELQRRAAIRGRFGTDQRQPVALGGRPALLIAVTADQQGIERQLLEKLVQFGRAKTRIERDGNR